MWVPVSHLSLRCWFLPLSHTRVSCNCSFFSYTQVLFRDLIQSHHLYNSNLHLSTYSSYRVFIHCAPLRPPGPCHSSAHLSLSLAACACSLPEYSLWVCACLAVTFFRCEIKYSPRQAEFPIWNHNPTPTLPDSSLNLLFSLQHSTPCNGLHILLVLVLSISLY